MPTKSRFDASTADVDILVRRVPVLVVLVCLSGACAPRYSHVQSGASPTQLIDADTPFTPLAASGRDVPASPQAQTVDVAILHVRCPSKARGRLNAIWDHVREERLDHDSRLGLARNGLRVGCGSSADWAEIKGIIDATEGCQSLAAAPVRLPQRFPLDLELDDGPRDQTLFAVEPDGVLSGATWKESRNVFRLVYERDVRERSRLQISVTPVVRQPADGYSWIPTDLGVAQVPRYGGRRFAGAGFRLSVERGEFILIGPGDQAVLRGLLGHVFMTRRADDDVYESYLFLHPAIPDEPAE